MGAVKVSLSALAGQSVVGHTQLIGGGFNADFVRETDRFFFKRFIELHAVTSAITTVA